MYDLWESHPTYLVKDFLWRTLWTPLILRMKQYIRSLGVEVRSEYDIPSGKLTQLLKMTIYSGFSH